MRNIFKVPLLRKREVYKYTTKNRFSIPNIVHQRVTNTHKKIVQIKFLQKTNSSFLRTHPQIDVTYPYLNDLKFTDKLDTIEKIKRQQAHLIEKRKKGQSDQNCCLHPFRTGVKNRNPKKVA
jgi:hypothetical protein